MRLLSLSGLAAPILSALACCSIVPQTSSAVELLTSGDFETPVGFDIPGWQLDESFTGSSATVNSASITGGEDQRLFLMPFVSGPISAADGNFDQLRPDDIDGNDLLAWQRGNSPNAGNAEDLTNWKNGFGRAARFTNAALTQVQPAVAGETYSFQGTSTFEDNYSGLWDTLDSDGPFGAIPSPTENSFRMEFLNATGAVIGTPATFDVAKDQRENPNAFPGTPLVHAPLVAQAPTGTTHVRVTAEATDMAWNGVASEGAAQSAFYNDFSLTASSDPSTEILTNGGLNDDPPDALEFWDLSTDPDASVNDEILRTPIAAWANNTPDGTRGVWLSAFFGGHATFEPEPVDGIMAQTVPVVAGTTYNFAGSTRFEANYSGGFDTIPTSSNPDVFWDGLASPTVTEIELAFLDVNGDVISSSVIDVKADREAQIGCSTDGCSNDGKWYDHTLQSVAPAEAVSARLTGRMIDGVHSGFNPQSAFFDDFSLTSQAAIAAVSSVPEPTSFASLACGMALLTMRRARRSLK